MFNWFGKKGDKDKTPSSDKGAAVAGTSSQAVRDRALAQFRATEAALGKETIHTMKKMLETMAAREQLMKKIEGVRKDVVADNLKAMLQDDKTAPPK